MLAYAILAACIAAALASLAFDLRGWIYWRRERARVRRMARVQRHVLKVIAGGRK